MWLLICWSQHRWNGSIRLCKRMQHACNTILASMALIEAEVQVLFGQGCLDILKPWALLGTRNSISKRDAQPLTCFVLNDANAVYGLVQE